MARSTSDDKTTSEKLASSMVQPPSFTSRHLLLSGVAVACVLGVGLGLWARPALSERRLAAPPPPPAAAPLPTPEHRELRIVVDNRAAPVTAPIEVLPAVASPPVATPPVAEPTPVEVAPIAAPTPTPVKAIKPLVVAPVVKVATPAPAAKRPPRQVVAKAPPPPVKPVVRLAKVAPHHEQAPAKVLAKAVKAPTKEKLRLAKAQEKPAKIVLAKAPAPKPHKLTKLVHAVTRVLHPEPKLERVRLVREKPEHGRKATPKLEVAVAKKPVARPAPHLVQASRPQRIYIAPPARPVGLMKVSNPGRCASPDPGAALVCANASLGAADRQMVRAYRDAQAAGVPDWQLQRQQQRWIVARAAAAREAPWAVHDVYQARIAELNGLAHDAQDKGE